MKISEYCSLLLRKSTFSSVNFMNSPWSSFIQNPFASVKNILSSKKYSTSFSLISSLTIYYALSLLIQNEISFYV